MTTCLPLRAAVSVAIALALGAGTLRAQSTMDSTFSVGRSARLSVQNMSGRVEVRSWSRAQIRVQAESERARVEFDANPNQLTVRTVTRRGNSEVDYRISVPVGTAVEINGISVDTDIGGVCGSLNVNTVSGDVTAQCLDGEGQIQTVSGDVTVTDARGVLEVNATSGEIDVRGARSSVTAHSVSGDVSLADISGNDVDVETVSGDVQYSGRILDNGRYRLAAHSGDVTLHITGSFNATVSVSTFSGDFASDFPIELQPGARVSREWQFKQGTGSARVRLDSFSGTINLRRGIGTVPREE
jgi:DUF4097 and DUF4098 domain-containing protein YvlB